MNRPASVFYGSGLEAAMRCDWADARQQLDQAIHMAPQLPFGYLGRAMVRQAQDDADGALRDCEQALHLDGGCPEAYVARANLRNLGNPNEAAAAIADCSTALSLEPACIAAYVTRALFNLTSTEAQIADMTRALRLDPHNPELYLQRARYFHDEALRWQPEYRGDELVWEGDPARQRAALRRALPDYDAGLGLEPDYGPAYIDRSTVLRDLGETTALEENDRILAHLLRSRGFSLRPRLKLEWQYVLLDHAPHRSAIPTGAPSRPAGTPSPMAAASPLLAATAGPGDEPGSLAGPVTRSGSWEEQLRMLAHQFGEAALPAAHQGVAGCDLTGVWAVPGAPGYATCIWQADVQLYLMNCAQQTPVAYARGVLDPSRWGVQWSGRYTNGILFQVLGQFDVDGVLRGVYSGPGPAGFPEQRPFTLVRAE